MGRSIRKREGYFVIHDNLGNIDNIVLSEEVSLLLPYADKLLKPILKKELTKKNKRCKVKLRSSVRKDGLFSMPERQKTGGK